MTPTSDHTLNQTLRDLSLAAVTPSQRAAFRVVEAALEVLACELGRAPVADTRAEALKVLGHNLALLVGDAPKAPPSAPIGPDTADLIRRLAWFRDHPKTRDLSTEVLDEAISALRVLGQSVEDGRVEMSATIKAARTGDRVLCAEIERLEKLLAGDREDLGTTQIPARYDTGDRETWDRIRDLLPGRVAFASGCLFNVVKYLDRAGKKGPADQDETKALFNLQGAAHVLVGLPDPRHRRPTFRPWVRTDTSAWPVRVYDLLDRLDGVGPGQGREAWKAMLDVLYVHTRRDHGGSP